ncbi:hypothetical protein BN2156_02394 [Mycolicibacterium neworleansense]|uniref:Lipoprotein n=2 Tax=Mycolicibacterium neworleansense TaxID=146018 RepID=A0A0H5RPY5_9MYCO|nr:hypothetical protein BN2156_02394 [Mycolicibacterium neworleansense]
MMIRMVRKTLAVTAAAVCVLAGCSDHKESPSAAPAVKTMYPNWPNDLNGFRFQWTAQPGIDLLTGPAIPVRAYLESFRTAFMTKSSANTYPGFQRAIPDLPDPRAGYDEHVQWGELPFELKWLMPAIDKDINFGDGPFFGNEYFHVLELSPLADGYLAYVCDGKYNIFHPAIGHSGKYASVLDYPGGKNDVQKREEAAVTLWRIEFKNGDAGDKTTQLQEGKSPAPIGDVFGNWKITGASQGNYWGSLKNTTHTPRDPDYVQRRQQCRDTMPHNVDERAQILMSVLDTPPQADPAVPGWPDNPT